MSAKNYYGLHEMEKWHRLLAEKWRPFVIKYMSLDADRTQKSKRNRLG